jgi:hypothetical protein
VSTKAKETICCTTGDTFTSHSCAAYLSLVTGLLYPRAPCSSMTQVDLV